MHPSAVQTAPKLPDVDAMSEGESLEAYVQDVLTVPASLAGLPAVSVPAPTGGGLPVGVSVVGQWGTEAMVLKVAQAIKDIAIE